MLLNTITDHLTAQMAGGREGQAHYPYGSFKEEGTSLLI
jgi:hypothetical protein